MPRHLCNHVKRGLAVLGWSAVLVGPFVMHWAIAAGQVTPAAIGLAGAQAGVLAAVALRRVGGWPRALGAAAAGLVAWLVLKSLASHQAGRAGLIVGSGLSHALIYASLLILFGGSLRQGRTALVTGLAARFRGRLTPAIVSYTRTVTKAWCVFFLAQLAGSAALLALAPDRVWSLFVNVLDGPLVVAMFLAEAAVRRWRFRDETHMSPMDVARAFARQRADG